VLYLLAACQKYEMASVQSFIRDEVNRGAFPAPKDAEAFSAYAIASGKGLIPEMGSAARHTLDHPMTFEVLGEGLRLFEGWALRDLADLRKRYQDRLVSCFESFLKTEESRFKFSSPCASFRLHPSGSNLDERGRRQFLNLYSRSTMTMSDRNLFLPSWLAELFQQYLNNSHDVFSSPLFNPQNIRGEYLSALKKHLKSFECVSCSKTQSLNGETICNGLEDKSTRALNEVIDSLSRCVPLLSGELWELQLNLHLDLI
jgi:hypothetical protein